MRVRVLRRHIQKAQRSRSGRNPVEVSLRECGLRGVEVDPYFGDVLFTRGNRRYSVDIPSEVSDYVDRYDSGEEVFPITFNIDLSSRAPANV
jgi:hypothetical protein